MIEVVNNKGASASDQRIVKDPIWCFCSMYVGLEDVLISFYDNKILVPLSGT